jgi:hypothetical protein
MGWYLGEIVRMPGGMCANWPGDPWLIHDPLNGGSGAAALQYKIFWPLAIRIVFQSAPVGGKTLF